MSASDKVIPYILKVELPDDDEIVKCDPLEIVVLPLLQEIEGTGRPVAEQEKSGLLPTRNVEELGEDDIVGGVTV